MKKIWQISSYWRPLLQGKIDITSFAIQWHIKDCVSWLNQKRFEMQLCVIISSNVSASANYHNGWIACCSLMGKGLDIPTGLSVNFPQCCYCSVLAGLLRRGNHCRPKPSYCRKVPPRGSDSPYRCNKLKPKREQKAGSSADVIPGPLTDQRHRIMIKSSLKVTFAWLPLQLGYISNAPVFFPKYSMIRGLCIESWSN